jgi:hypothetical protein
MAARSSALRAGRTLTPGFFFKIPGIHFEAESTHRDIVWLEELGKLEKIHLGTQTRDLLACSRVP